MGASGGLGDAEVNCGEPLFECVHGGGTAMPPAGPFILIVHNKTALRHRQAHFLRTVLDIGWAPAGIMALLEKSGKALTGSANEVESIARRALPDRSTELRFGLR